MENTLKERRKQLHLTQEELASKSGVSRQTISLIENHNLNNIESNTMIKLALALNCDIGDIFFKEFVVFTKEEKKERENNEEVS